jgi:hypothetical protein
VDYLFDDYYHPMMMMINLNDLMVLTMVVNFVKHLKMHLNIIMNYLDCLIFDAKRVRLILDWMILNDDDENWLKQDDLLLVVLVHVLQRFVDAI